MTAMDRKPSVEPAFAGLDHAEAPRVRCACCLKLRAHPGYMVCPPCLNALRRACAGKVRHTTLAEAEASQRERGGRNRQGNRFHSYVCPVCLAFHVGGMSGTRASVQRANLLRVAAEQNRLPREWADELASRLRRTPGRSTSADSSTHAWARGRRRGDPLTYGTGSGGAGMPAPPLPLSDESDRSA